LPSLPVRTARHGRLWARLAALVLPVSGALLAACGAGTPATVNPNVATGPKLSGLGATLSEWNAHHQRSTGQAADATGYGPSIPLKTGSIDEFTALTVVGGRVTGWKMAFKDGTTIASAEEEVRTQLPADTRQTASRRGTYGHSSDTCEIVSFESEDLAKVLGSGQGTAGVILHQVGVSGLGSPSIAVVDRAVVQVPALPATASC